MNMLPLDINKLDNDNEWHELKSVLISFKYLSFEEASNRYSALSKKLRETPVGKELKNYQNGRSEDILNRAAKMLTQSELDEAWLYLERL